MSINVTKIPFEAIKELPKTLYKYRTWTDKLHKTILTKKIVFLAKPTSFEDKMDCKLLERHDLLTPLEIWEKCYKYGKHLHPNNDELDLRKFATEKFKNSPMFDQNFIRKHQEETFIEFDKRFGVLSLTDNSINQQMWSKYSDDHKGFCVGFHPLILFEHLGGGGKVKYVDELPIIMPTESLEEKHIKQVFYKEKKWEFEQEYRTHYFSYEPLTDYQRTRKLPNECYKELIFGSKMSEKHRIEIKNICVSKGLSIDFFEEVYDSVNDTITLKKIS